MNFDLNYDLTDSEIKEAKKKIQVTTCLTNLCEYVALLYATSDCLRDKNDEVITGLYGVERLVLVWRVVAKQSACLLFTIAIQRYAVRTAYI